MKKSPAAAILTSAVEALPNVEPWRRPTRQEAEDAVRTYLEGLQGTAGGELAPHVQRHGRGLVHLQRVEAGAPVAAPRGP